MRGRLLESRIFGPYNAVSLLVRNMEWLNLRGSSHRSASISQSFFPHRSHGKHRRLCSSLCSTSDLWLGKPRLACIQRFQGNFWSYIWTGKPECLPYWWCWKRTVRRINLNFIQILTLFVDRRTLKVIPQNVSAYGTIRLTANCWEKSSLSRWLL